MDKKQIETMLDLHRKWLHDDPDGERADLQGADLRRADLRRADLRRAYLRRAYLQGADLRRADLRRADLQGADLRRAYLQGADLRRADLRRADLQGADLRRAENASLAFAQTCVCPQKGAFIGFKKASCCGSGVSCIVELEIPADAKRSNASGRKCRASKARVVSITDLEGNAVDDDQRAFSWHDNTFIYSVGATVEPTEPFDEDRWNECAPGIHFFITREEAVAW